MGGAPDFPDQSPQAAAASQAQLGVLDAQRAAINDALGVQNLLTPELLRTLGFQLTVDEQGRITDINRSRSGQREDRARALTTEREIQALNGKLPIDAQTTQELDRQEQVLREQLTRSLGPDYMGTTAGQQAMADFRQRRANVVDSASRQDVLAYGNLAAQRQNQIDAAIQTALGISTAPIPGIQVMGQNAAGYGNIVGMDNQIRGAEYQAAVQANGSMWGGIGSMVGLIGGAAVGGPFGASMGAGIGNLFGSGGSSGLSGMLPDIYGAAGLGP